MIIRSNAVVNFSCPTCKSHVTECLDGGAFLPLRDSFPSAVLLESVLQCYSCRTVFDLEVSAQTEIEPYAARLPGFLGTSVTFESLDDQEDQLLDLMPPDAPFVVLKSAYHNLSDIVAEYGDEARGPLSKIAADAINRMVYASAISALEAFLADLLKSNAAASDIVLKNLLTGVDELSSMTLSLADVHKNPKLVLETVLDYLTNILYHKFEKVWRLYFAAFKIDIFPDAQIKSRLYRARDIRHDIVHRNGKTKSGELISMDAATVEALLEDVSRLATHVSIEVAGVVPLFKPVSSRT